MITDAQFIEQETELLAIFEREETRTRKREQSAPAEETVQREAAQEARIRRIIELAQYEVVLKDTTSFLFQTLGAGIDGLAKAAFGALDPATRRERLPDETSDTHSGTSSTKGANPENTPIDNSEGGNP